MQITPLHSEIGASVSGIDLSTSLTQAMLEDVEAAINRYSILVFPGQQLNDEQHVAFTSRLGELEEEHVSYYSRGVVTYIGRIGNIDANGRHQKNQNRRVRSQTANNLWHSDSSFREIPAKFSLLYAYEVPEQGGDTEFVSARAAYARLTSEKQSTLDTLVGIHDYIYSRTSVGEDAVNDGQRTYMRPVRQRLVRKNPFTGDKNLYLGSHVRTIEGWSEERSRVLLDELMDQATRPQSIYRHQWRQGDLMMWDNRCVLHRGCGFDADRYRRRLHQTRVRCPAPSLAEPID